MAERKQYSEESKAAVMAALLMGQSISHIAKEYKIPEGTVKSWQARLKDSPVAKVATQKKERIGDLIIEYVSAALRAMQAQVEVASHEDYLKKQPASEFAILHGVIADKAIRILEAIAADPDGDTDNPEPTA